jgi:NAD(P)-dependent dehydrogenase (short-subunit alcohol dehydrogenase family)
MYHTSNFGAFSLLAVCYTGLFHLCNLLPPFRAAVNQLPAPPSANAVEDSSSSSSRKVCIVTGSNTGIGRETALKMAKYNYKVIVACRSEEKGRAACSSIPNSEFMKLDLSSFASVREFAAEFKKKHKHLTVLVNNAGMNSFQDATATADGLDLCYQTNFLGHFLLTNLLLPCFDGPDCRIVNLSSVMHHFASENVTPEQWKAAGTTVPNPSAYADSKLASILFTKELNRRHGSKLQAIAVNPGAVNSDIWRALSERNPRLYRHVIGPLFRTLYLDVDEGSTTSAAAALVKFPRSVFYLQPYALPFSGQRVVDGVDVFDTPFPPFEMMAVFKGFAATVPRLPGGDGDESATGLWEGSCRACGIESER